MNRLQTNSARPTLEAMEDRTVPTYLAAALPEMGVWRYSPSGIWVQLTAAEASQVAADSHGDVIGIFPGQGVWLCTPDNTWRQLTASNAASLDVAYHPFADPAGPHGTIAVVAEFPGQGLWRWGQDTKYPAAGGWTQLTANDAAAEAIDQNGNVAAEFRGQGVWRHDGMRWQQLTAADASVLALRAVVDGASSLAAEFPGWGVWRFQDGTGWQQLTANDAVALGVDAAGDVAATFIGWGVWGYGDPAGAAAHHWAVGWNHLTAADANLLGIDAGSVYGGFPGSGIWWFGGYTWTDMRVGNASSLGIGA
jgi:hypothetical protein